MEWIMFMLKMHCFYLYEEISYFKECEYALKDIKMPFEVYNLEYRRESNLSFHFEKLMHLIKCLILFNASVFPTFQSGVGAEMLWASGLRNSIDTADS